MLNVPENIISAKLVNLRTGEASLLETKGTSYCHFVAEKDRVQLGCYELQFRLDWKDRSDDGDPTLDADIYDATGRQVRPAIRQSVLGTAHHTSRSFDGNRKLYTYHFTSNGIELEFLTELIGTSTQTANGRIM